MKEHDDLSEWSEDPLVRALRAPGTPSELAGEQQALSAYRSALPGRSVRRIAGRLGVGGTALVGTLVLSSGVAAAAYTQALPEPAQTIAHRVLGPIGVPDAPSAAPPRRQVAEPVAITGSATPTAEATSASPSPNAHRPVPPGPGATSPDSSPSPKATPRSGRTKAPAGEPTSTPTQAPTPTPTPTPTSGSTASATPTPSDPATPPPAASSVSIALTSRRVAPGDVAFVSGSVTSDSGSPMADQPVRLVVRPAGSSGWTVVAEGRTGEDGTIAVGTSPLDRTTVVRLIAGRNVHSRHVRVVMVPTVSASASAGSVNVTTEGAQPGDRVQLVGRRNGRPVVLRTGTLDGAGAVTFSVPPAGDGRRVVVRLLRTPAHAQAATRVVISSDSGESGPGPSPGAQRGA